jgi:hypothetical protein
LRRRRATCRQTTCWIAYQQVARNADHGLGTRVCHLREPRGELGVIVESRPQTLQRHLQQG